MPHPAQPTRQVHGIAHMRVGETIVTAMNDGYVEVPLELLTNIEPGHAAATHAARFGREQPRLLINSFLIWSSDGPVLVDTGAGPTMGATAGRLSANLATLGVAPEAVRTVLLTHLHRDHAAGLIDADGAAAFPNAEIVAHRDEAAFWLDPARAAAAPEAARESFALAQAQMAPNRDRMRLVGDGDLAGGVTAVALPGHTPGHTGWRVDSGGKSLLIWGDVVHLPTVQFAEPGTGVAFDVDGEEAAATRKRAMEMAATERLMVAGIHHEFPAFGYVARDGAGYRFVPALWDPGL